MAPVRASAVFPAVAAFVVALVVCTSAQAQPTLRATLMASDGGPGDLFGLAVAVSGDGSTAAIGTNVGAVYIFTRTGSTWAQQAKLTATGPGPLNGLWLAISHDGNTVAGGNPTATVNGQPNRGVAYVFTRSGTTWNQQAALTASAGAPDELFGNSGTFSRDGNTLLIGAPAFFSGTTSGKAYVFTRAGGGWTEQAILMPGDPTIANSFGLSVALSAAADTALVTASGAPAEFPGNGAAYIFTRSGSTWTQEAKLIRGDGNNSFFAFGFAAQISADGSTAIVSNDARDVDGVPDAGMVYVWSRTGSTWSVQARLIAANPAPNNLFGWSMGLNGEAIIIGTLSNIDGVAAQGAFYEFIRTGSTWAQRSRTTRIGGAFGQMLAASQDIVVAAAAVTQVGANANQGVVYVYQLTPVLNSVAPATVSTNGGQTVTIVAPNAASGAAVTAGGSALQTVSVDRSTVTGTTPPHAPGTFDLVLTNPSGAAATLVNGLTYACPAVVVGPSSLPGATAGAAYAQSFAQTGSTATSTFGIASGALPAGLSLSSGGALTGSPTVTGSFTFSVRATDANTCTGSQAYTLAVGCQAIAVSPALLAGGTAGVAYPSTALSQSGGIGATTFAVTSGALPAGMTLSSAGVLSGTPSGPGTFTFSVTASDANACGGSRAYTLVIACATSAVTPGAIASATLGRAYSAAFSSTGFVGTPQFSVSSGALPAGLSLSSAGVVSGSPTALGRFSFTVAAVDGTSCAADRAYALEVNRGALIATGADAGGAPHVRSFTSDGAPGPGAAASFFAYDPAFSGFSSGVRVAQGDVNGDGAADLITAPGAGSPLVRVFDGVSGAIARAFLAYDWSPADGVYVAAGDVNGDGIADVITGAGGSPPLVRAFDGRNGALLRELLADVPSWTGGVRVAAGDVNGDGLAEIITASGPGGAPVVKLFDAASGGEIRRFFAYDPGFSGGVYVAAGDVSGDGIADIVTGAGAGAGPHVRVWHGVSGTEIMGFFAYDPAFRGGVRVAAGDVNGDGRADVITAAGPGGGPHALVFDGATSDTIGSFFAYPPNFSGGVFVAAAAPLPRMAVDTPQPGATVSAPFAIAGWAFGDDLGIDPRGMAIHVWAFPAAGGAPVFVGATTAGAVRPDVGAAFGGAAAAGAFHLTATGLSPGTYDLVVFVFNPRTATPTIRRVVRVVVR